MKRVLDSSVGFKWLVPELHSDKALRLRDDYRNGILELIAPDIFLVDDRMVKSLQPHFPVLISLASLP